ncbi:hypothetical protein EVAR_90286_1 [Eumeta japonica]|uniref:Uncharacterized protein n=1 Tax=Eumeta variegata TaxID=151549 RepID=A0A4C1Z2Z9_EUMVA|nr:hypothetical protein EVAR_90286_1 [Eumeta japonica]
MRLLRSICGASRNDRYRSSDVKERCGLQEDVVTRVERGVLRRFMSLTELDTLDEEGDSSKADSSRRRTPSVSGGLPMLLLSVLPPVIPRASCWPSADACRARASVSFSSQPKLNFRKSQPTIDLYNLCLMKRPEENTGLLKRLKSFFGSRPTSRKASTMSIADPTGESIAAALRMHVGMLAGLVPASRKHSMVVSCNTLNVPRQELALRRESYAQSGPIIRVTDEEPSCSGRSPEPSCSRAPQKYIAEPETKVNFILPTTHKAISHQNSFEKIKGSPRFPHRIAPVTTSLTTLNSKRKRSTENVFTVSGRSLDEQYRRYSHQNVANQEFKGKSVLETRWKSTDDASAPSAP